MKKIKRILLFVLITTIIIAKPMRFLGNNSGKEKHKQYVSTIGSKIYLNKNAKFFTKYGVVKIKNIEGKNKFVEILRNNVVYETTEHKMMVNLLLMQIENRDYSKETIFIVYSPATLNIEIDQPYYYEPENNTLFFDKKINEKSKNESFSYIRVYLLNGDKINFKKFILNDTTKIKLEILEF